MTGRLWPEGDGRQVSATMAAADPFQPLDILTTLDNKLPFKDKMLALLDHFPTARLLALAVFSILVTWLIFCQRVVDFLVSIGNDEARIDRGVIAVGLIDFTTLGFGLLMFLAAGVVTSSILLVRGRLFPPVVSQLIWATTVVVLLMLTKPDG